MSWACFISLKCSVFIKYTTQRQTQEPVRKHLELRPLITGCHCGSHSRIVMCKSLEKEPVRQMRLTTAERQLQLTRWSALTIESALQPGSLHLFSSFTMEIYPQIPMKVSAFFLFVLLLSDHLHSQSSKRKRNSGTMTQSNRTKQGSKSEWRLLALWCFGCYTIWRHIMGNYGEVGTELSLKDWDFVEGPILTLNFIHIVGDDKAVICPAPLPTLKYSFFNPVVFSSIFTIVLFLPFQLSVHLLIHIVPLTTG